MAGLWPPPLPFPLLHQPPPIPVDKKAYYCQKCENHNIRHPRRNHKTECPHHDCRCEKCLMVDERCRLNAEIKATLESDPLVETLLDEEAEAKDAGPIERKPCCQRCRAHGLKRPLKNHKRKCEFKNCTCDKCNMVEERRRLMARQIKLRREQKRDRERMEKAKMDEARAEQLKVMQTAFQHPHLLTPHPIPMQYPSYLSPFLQMPLTPSGTLSGAQGPAPNPFAFPSTAGSIMSTSALSSIPLDVSPAAFAAAAASKESSIGALSSASSSSASSSSSSAFAPPPKRTETDAPLKEDKELLPPPTPKIDVVN